MKKMKNYFLIKQFRYGLILLCIILIIAVLAPIISPYNPYELGDKLFETPGKEHLLGTDSLGRDVLSMIIYGTRVSLLVGITAALISALVGILIGAVAGYYGGKIDKVLSAVIDIFLMIPSFFLILIIVAVLGCNILNMMIVIGLTTWTRNARVMRAQALSLRERTFVKGAVAIGEAHRSILFRHIIPNGIFPIIANTTMGVSTAIITEAGLSFLGLGDPNIISWGQMILAGRASLTSAWWVSTFAGVAIVITVMAFYLIGDGINIIINPKLSKTK